MFIHARSLHWSRGTTITAVAFSALAAVSLGSGTAAASNTITSMKTPAGYKIVHTGALTLLPGSTGVGVTCPKVSTVQLKPLSGGAVASFGDTSVSIESSFPTATGWETVLNNSGANATYAAWVVCAKPTSSYKVVTHQADNPAGHQTSAVVVCPSGDKVTGGGVAANAASLDVNMNESAPNDPLPSYGWAAAENNASTGDDTMTVYAVCSKFSTTTNGYSVVEGPSTPADTGAQTGEQTSCPVVGGIQTSVLGGGLSDPSVSTAVNIAATWPNSSTEWAALLNNESGSATTLDTWAVCAY